MRKNAAVLSFIKCKHEARTKLCRNMCASCYQQAYRGGSERQRQNHLRIKRKYSNKYNLTKPYGVTVEQFETQLALQGGGCAVCTLPRSSGNRRLAVDHDHATGQIRGIICDSCNSIIAALERGQTNGEVTKRRAEFLGRMIDYLNDPPGVVDAHAVHVEPRMRQANG